MIGAADSVQKRADQYRTEKMKRIEMEEQRKFLEEEAKWKVIWGGALTPLVRKTIPVEVLEKLRLRGYNSEKIKNMFFPEKYTTPWELFPEGNVQIYDEENQVVRIITDKRLSFYSAGLPLNNDELQLTGTFQGKGVVLLGYSLYDGIYPDMTFPERFEIGPEKKRFIVPIVNRKAHRILQIFLIVETGDLQCIEISLRKKIK